VYKKILFLCVLFLLLAAAAGPRVVSAGVDPLASPTPRPTERITAPVITGVNPDAVLSEGNLADSLPSGSFVPAGISLPVLVDPPIYVELKSQPTTQYNTFSDSSKSEINVNCGPAALAQSLRILDPEGINLQPTTNQLSAFMSKRGLMYDWGTGVEELAYAAREFGYEGSIPFKGWSLEQVAEVLNQGKSVVIPLGTNGENRPGHFVTLTDISEDGRWITIQDSTDGESILSREEFLSLWQKQGSSGMIPQKELSATQPDPMLPWMGLFGAISALALTVNQSAGSRESKMLAQLRKQLANPLRKGIGAGPLPPKKPEMIQVPRYKTETVYRGIKTVEEEIPVYVTRKVKVGVREVKRKIPQYKNSRVKVGVESVIKRVPVYKTKKVKCGFRLVKKKIPVTRYQTKKVMVWKKFTSRVPVYQYIGSKRIVIGYKNKTRWKRVPITKKIPYQTTKTISVQEPVYKEKKFISGYEKIIEEVPKFKQKKVLVGYKTIKEIVPVYEERKIQTGTKTVTRQIPQYETVRIPIIDEKEPSEGSDSSPPTGFSSEIWNSLSTKDQQKIRQKGIDWAKEKERLDAAKENWMYKTYLRGQEAKENVSNFFRKLGLPVSPEKPNNLFSLSAYKDLEFDMFKENGIVIDSYTPPNILNLLYMEQKLSIQPKVVVTAFPGGPFDLNISSKSLKMKVGNFALFGTQRGEIGFLTITDPQDSNYHYIVDKHSIIFAFNGITYKYKKEGVKESEKLSNDQLDIKEVETLQCKLKTIKTEGLLVIVSGTIIIASLIYLLMTTGNLLPAPISL